MSRKFTKDEKILLILCSVIIVAIAYYQFVWKSTNQTIATYNVAAIEDELTMTQLKAAKIKEMAAYIEANKIQTIGQVADYNNLQNEITELNTILSDAISYKLNFEGATTDNKIVRRNVNIDFQASSYSSAKKIVEALKNSRYKSLVRDLSIRAGEKGLQATNQVSVNLKVTFYEGITDAVAQAGLPGYEQSSKE